MFFFGVVFCSLITGEKRFTADGLTAITRKVVHTESPRLRQLNPMLSEDLEKVVAGCRAKEADPRCLSGQALAADLRAIRNGQLVGTVN